MKSIGTVILAAGIIFLPQLLPAQTVTGTPDSIVRITAEAQGLPWVPPGQAPPFGTFWLITADFSGPVPLPCPPDNPNFPIYVIADGQFLVDGTGGQTPAARLAAQAEAVVNLISQVQAATANRQVQAMGMSGSPLLSGGGDSPAYQSLTLDTNRLWLEMVTVTNQTASLVIHPPWNVTNEVYELLYATNLLTPPAAWQWVLRSDPQETNLLAPNATGAQGFYRLSSPNDLVANDSLGTNFWLTFYSMNDNDTPVNLSLYISSPVGATGMVTTPGLTANGPLLVVTNCGDSTVNGTYVLTNLTAQEQADWLANNFSTNAASYEYGNLWVVAFGSGYWVMFDYNGGTGLLTPLYDKSGANLNGSPTDWGYDGDPGWPYPTTLCAQVPLVNQSFTVAAGAVTNISLPQAVMLFDYDMVETNGINVTASQPVAVYALDYDPAVSAAFTTYPATLLGSNYCVLARDGTSWGNSQLAIVATETNTIVTITPSPTADLAGSVWMAPFTLQPGETYQVQSSGGGDDVTGTWITSDHPVAVFAGAYLAEVPSEMPTGNPLVQEQMPVDSWGTQVLAIAFAALSGGDYYRVLAAYTNTVVLTNGVVAGTNQAGQFLDLIIDGPVEFQGSQPIQVAQFANGYYLDNATNILGNPNEGDPCEILLPPIGHCLLTNIVATGPSADFLVDPPTGFDRNYLNIIVVQSAITNILVDGSHIAATNFVAIGSSGYYGAQISVTNGIHTVISSQPAEVEVYGFGYCDAYSYSGGFVK